MRAPYWAVKFIFQPAEELGHGAFKIIETHALQDVQAVLGFHNDPSRSGAIKTEAITQQ